MGLVSNVTFLCPKLLELPFYPSICKSMKSSKSCMIMPYLSVSDSISLSDPNKSFLTNHSRFLPLIFILILIKHRKL